MQIVGWIKWKLHKWSTGHRIYWPVRAKGSDRIVCRLCGDCGRRFK